MTLLNPLLLLLQSVWMVLTAHVKSQMKKYHI